jgi:ATP-dependent DNA helicase RecG
MSLPDWADEHFSKELPVLRSRGEGQHLEYMESFPQQARELAKEIAAFATSNQGIILLGVSDSGDRVGLADAKTPQGRDSLMRRIEGICRGTVKPAITPRVCFAVEITEVVVVILVPKGSQPLYYCENRPFLRHLSESRPAEPHEAVDLVRSWLQSNAPASMEEDESSEITTEVLRLLTDLIIYGEEINHRNVNPWLDLVLNQFRYASATLRQVSALPVAVENGLTPDLESLAGSLDEILAIPIVMGYWDNFEKHVRQVVERAKSIKNRFFDSHGLSPSNESEVKKGLLSQVRKLRSLDGRAEKLIDQGRLDDVQTEASEIGMALLHLGYLPLDDLRAGLSEVIQEVGHDLHLIETARIYMDGGKSVRGIIDRIKAERQGLEEAVASINDSNQPNNPSAT